MGIVRKFIDCNKKISNDFLRRHPLSHNENVNELYKEAVKKYIKDDSIIYDIGGGKHCHYINEIDKKNVYVCAVDISKEELEVNALVNEKIVSDVCKKIPLPYGQVDMITSSSVLEHLLDPQAFFLNASESLKAGGMFIHTCPSRYAIFAVINRILPQKLSRKVLFFFLPEAKRTSGFPAYYINLYYKKIKKMLKKAGLELLYFIPQYRQCSYFSFFYPLFLLTYFWDFLMKKLKLKNMSAYFLIVARKPLL